MPRKVLDVRKECVRLSCQRQTKSPSGLSVGGLFAYRHAPERLRSRTPWNKSSAYVSNTHYKSEIFKSVILPVLYHIRHFNVFVVKRKTLTFVKVENTFFGKRFYYVFNVNALRVLVVNKPYDFGFFFVYYDFVVFYFIAVNDSSARKVAFLSCFVHSALYLLRKFGRVIFGVAFK